MHGWLCHDTVNGRDCSRCCAVVRMRYRLPSDPLPALTLRSRPVSSESRYGCAPDLPALPCSFRASLSGTSIDIGIDTGPIGLSQLGKDHHLS